MGEEDRGGLPDPDPNLSPNQGGLPDLDLDPTQFLSRYYPPRDISHISAVQYFAPVVDLPKRVYSLK